MLSIRETSSATHGSVEEQRERTKRGQLSVVKEGSRAKIQENLGENIQYNLLRNGYGSGRLIYQKVTEQMEGIHLLQSISFFVQGNAHTTLLSHSAPSFYNSQFLQLPYPLSDWGHHLLPMVFLSGTLVTDSVTLAFNNNNGLFCLQAIPR